MSKKKEDMSTHELSVRDQYNANRKFLPDEVKAKRRLVTNANARKTYPQKRLDRPEMFMLRKYKSRDKSCTLTREWVRENIIKKACIYCGHDKGMTCDRKDPLKGYTQENCVPACRVCNTAKWNYISFEDFFRVGEVIKKLREEGKLNNY